MLPFTYRCPRCENIQESNDPPSVINICYECGKVDIPLYSVDLDYIKPEGIVKLLQEELKRRSLRRKVKVKLYWTDRTGSKCEVSKMSKLHVENIIRRVGKFIITN